MVEFITPERFTWEEHTNTYGRFVVEPLEKGYGVTIGNALRRVLLSSIEGAAPTAVKFEGAYHEFTTLPGVVEDLTEIVLNIKKLRFVLHGEGPVFIELKKKGPGKVYAKDFELPSQLELLTPDQEIATLDNESSEIEIHLRVDKGKGFVLSEDIQEIFDISTLGWIPLDADFSPIKKVTFKVEDTRVGRRTDYNKLTFEIWTDGSITPKDAVVRASNILIDHFSQIRDRLVEALFAVEEAQEPKEEVSEVLNQTLEEAGLSGRALKVLKEHGIETVKDLVALDRKELESLKGLGKKSIADIEAFLSQLGLELGGGK
ncbi:DNA-directed RNA polymerase subunit alpha [Thermovibrio ammonificans]|uniref:DNA-directed RNA polymerase subunit alpha n=1 Tax=Thermovibrio ammonificans (strain DSM 15698 / JCM 12110 / HB-1) TaxID=648996 RepID=E8T4C3_THEA1|nr:DNA-directed RNA polymerase subunit alpha [Thermovibrio ammonificans]ADU96258.1 DNA-directed RNA polymerase, alpha subunit [Thermovibrio ammonificans HB-1]